jgi:hypothetical protein
MLSILNARVLNKLKNANKYEKKVLELKRKSGLLDKNLIHSLTILKGNVISIIASF